MFIVKNISNKRVLILDLGLLILQGEIKDLDALFDRKDTESSKYLKAAFKEEVLAIVNKDQSEDTSNLDKLIRDKINSISENQNAMNDVHRKMDILLNAIADLKNNPQQIIVQNTPNSSEKEEEKVDNNIDDQQIIDIHSRSIKRISKDVSGSINTEETKKKSDIDDRLDELEGLI